MDSSTSLAILQPTAGRRKQIDAAEKRLAAAGIQREGRR